MFGFNEIYNQLLLEAKSPEEIKKILEYQFVQGHGVPQEVLDKVFKIDPTRKKTYTRWVLMQWETQQDVILKSLANGTLQEMFNYFQERANSGLNLIGMKSFKDALDVVPHKEKDPIFGNISTENKNKPENDFDIVYDSPEWRIVRSNTWQSNEKLGKGCKWCTAGAYGDGKDFFERYSSLGPLWVNFDKRSSEIAPMDNIEYPYTRYQFCFEYGNRGELMDSNDDRVNIEEMNIPEDVLEFYNSQDPYYLEILKSDNENEVWERYDNERIEHTILIKEPVLSNSVLRFMPSFKEYEPEFNEHDSYGMYREDDLHDSIDGIEYPDASYIYDKCEGYNMIVMKNDTDFDDKYNIYYETDRNWYGVTTNFYDSSKNGKFFYEEDYEYFYFKLASFPNYNITYQENSFTFIENAYIVEYKNMPTDFQNGLWIKINFDEMFSGLIYVDPKTKTAKTIIKKDTPIGTEYQIKKSDKGYYIEGKLKNYWLSNLDSDDDKQNFELENFLINKDYAIVKYRNENSIKTFGLYDLLRKEIILKDAEYINDLFDNIVIVSYKDYKILFNYITRKFVTRPFTENKSIHKAPLLYAYASYNGITEKQEWYIFDTYSQKEHGPFFEIEQGLNYDNLVIVIPFDNSFKKRIFNVNTGKFVTNDNYIEIKTLDSILSICQTDNETYLFNANNNSKICNIDDSIKPIVMLNDTFNSVYAYKAIDGKTNLVSTKYEILLPKNVDSIRRFYQDCHIIPFIDNNNWFYIDVDDYKNILPSVQGIPKNCIRNQRITDANKILFEIDIDFNLYLVTYNFKENKIMSIKHFEQNDNNVPTEIIQQIEKIFFPNKVQISEQMRLLINKMNSL